VLSHQKKTRRTGNSNAMHPKGLLQLHRQTKKENSTMLGDHLVLPM